MISQTRLKELLEYEPSTGLFIWLKRTSNRTHVGAVAGGTCKGTGYIQIQVDGKNELAHRLAWLYMTGDAPTSHLDHRDGCRVNNKWDNIRIASRSENMRNKSIQSNNTVGLKGVSPARSGKNKWRARISDGVRQSLIGTFDCPAAAHFAYQVEADKTFGEFARAR